MNTGAAAARGDLLWFLHLDAEPPSGAVDAMLSAVARGHVWGRFDVRLSGAEPMLRVVARMMNLRSRLTGIATGDQGIFVVRDVFDRTGGYPVIALMEDIALSKRLKRVGRPACLRQRIVASSRRWEQAGIWRTIVLMWRLRLGYWLGIDPATLGAASMMPRASPLAGAASGSDQRRAGGNESGRGRHGGAFGLGCRNAVSACTRLALRQGAGAGTGQDADDSGARRGRRRSVCTRGCCGRRSCACPRPQSRRSSSGVHRTRGMRCSVSWPRLHGLTLHQQRGEDLGERLLAASADALGRADSVALIGSDCPELDTAYLAQAFDALRSTGVDAVLGPAADGGYVLLALRRAEPALFTEMPWGGDQVAAITRERMAALGWRWRELPVLRDVDRPPDLLWYPSLAGA